MSLQYEVITASGQSVYITNATRHSYNTDRHELQLTSADYKEVGVFYQPQGFVVTGSSTIAAPAPAYDTPF